MILRILSLFFIFPFRFCLNMHDGRRCRLVKRRSVHAEPVYSRWLERSRAFNQLNASPPDRNIKCGLLFQQHIQRAIQRDQSDASLLLIIFGAASQQERESGKRVEGGAGGGVCLSHVQEARRNGRRRRRRRKAALCSSVMSHYPSEHSLMFVGNIFTTVL